MVIKIMNDSLICVIVIFVLLSLPIWIFALFWDTNKPKKCNCKNLSSQKCLNCSHVDCIYYVYMKRINRAINNK